MVIPRRRSNLESIQIDDLNARTAFCRQSSPGVLDQDAAHRFSGGTEEMPTILKSRGISAAQPHPCLMHEGGGLERVAGGFVDHLLRGKPAEFFVNDWE